MKIVKHVVTFCVLQVAIFEVDSLVLEVPRIVQRVQVNELFARLVRLNQYIPNVRHILGNLGTCDLDRPFEALQVQHKPFVLMVVKFSISKGIYGCDVVAYVVTFQACQSNESFLVGKILELTVHNDNLGVPPVC